MERRLDADKKHDIICAAFRKNSEQVENIRELVDSLVLQSQISKLECLQSFLEDFEQADTFPRLEQRNIESILAALEFKGMNARRQQVQDTVGDTFEWIITKDDVPYGHPDLKMSFKEWLSHGNGVFHVTGKPGSGKSTLMKLIDQDAATQEQLENWASGTGGRLIMARFYTWKAASSHHLQNQEEGLTRTLLHQILSAAPQLAPIIFAEHSCWNPQKYRLINILSQNQVPSAKIQFEPKEIIAALEFSLRIRGYRFFLLIDGMDEFEKAHDHRAIATRVLQWSSSNLSRVKICVSSREDNAFMDRFSADQRLRLHIVTNNDVRELVTTRLMEHDVFAESSTENRQGLIEAVVDRAEGVFLWVVLTVQELKLLLDDRQSFQAILQAVRKLPKEMEEYFRETLSRIPPGYKEESEAVFSVVASLFGKGENLCLFHYSMLRRCIENDDPNIVNDSCHMSLDEVVSQIREFRSRLPSLCKGLLVTRPGRGYGIPYQRLSIEHENHTIQCNHRSVFDFLRKFVRKIPATEDSDFQAHARGNILAIRSAIEVIRAFPWDVTMATSYCGLLRVMLTEIQYPWWGLRLTHEADYIFPFLRTLDATLFRKQGAIEFMTSFESTALGDSRLDKNTVSIFSIAFQHDFCQYIDWASKNYPPWVLTEEAKSWAVSAYASKMSDRDDWPWNLPCIPFRCLAETGWLSINEPVLANRTATPSFFPVQRASIWVNFLICVMIYDHIRPMLSSEFNDAFSAGAEPRIRFRWCSQTGSPTSSLRSTRKADLVRMKPHSPEGTTSLRSRAEHHRDMPSCSRYEMTIELGDAHELEYIQVPQGPGEEHIRLGRFFEKLFGTPSGNATLKDLLEIFLTSDDYDVFAHMLHDDTKHEKARDCLKAIDDALARVGTFSTTDTRSDSSTLGNITKYGQHPDTGESANSDPESAQHVLTPPDDPISRLSWLGPRKYLYYSRTVLISSLGKPRPCYRLLPLSAWRAEFTD